MRLVGSAGSSNRLVDSSGSGAKSGGSLIVLVLWALVTEKQRARRVGKRLVWTDIFCGVHYGVL